MKYISAEDILVIHAQIVGETGGMHGVRDIDLLTFSAYKPKTKFGGEEQFRGIFEKAAAYLDSFARHQIFSDGNKRTAIAVAARFLFINGYEFSATNKELERFVLRVAVKEQSMSEISEWLKKNSKKIKK